MGNADRFEVEVVYLAPGGEWRRRVQVPRGACVRDALAVSGFAAEHPEIDLARQPLGVFGAVATLDTPLSENDRVEVYRPLLIDPKQARRARARRRNA